MPSKLLVDESPLQLSPTLAARAGLNEAIVLQQMHYWLLRYAQSDQEGVSWIHYSYAEWERQFPFFSERTIRRTIESLEKKELIRSSRRFENGEKSKFYTIEYDKIAALVKMTIADAKKPPKRAKIELEAIPKLTTPHGQNGHSAMSKLTTPPWSNWPPLYKEENINTDYIKEYSSLPASEETKPVDVSKSSSKPSSKSRSKPVDPRWKPFLKDLKVYWDFKNPGVDMPFNGRTDGLACKLFLSDFPEITQRQWQQCLQHRARSDVVHTQAVRYWVRRLMDFYDAPLDQYNKPKKSGDRRHDQQLDLLNGNIAAAAEYLRGKAAEAETSGRVSDKVRPLLEPPDQQRTDTGVGKNGNAIQREETRKGLPEIPGRAGTLPGTGHTYPDTEKHGWLTRTRS